MVAGAPIARWAAARSGRGRAWRPVVLGALAAVSLAALAPSADGQDARRAAVEQFFAHLVSETTAACPLASPADQAALDRCRAALYRDSALRRGLAPVVVWGRPSPDGKRLRDTNATQFAP